MKTPAEPYTRTETGSKANIGNYHISHAYGGVNLHKMSNEGGGISEVLAGGHMPKKDLYHMMHAYLNGISDTAL